MFESMHRDARAVINSVIHLAYFMRGAITYDDLMLKTRGERDMMRDFLEERFEAEKNNPNPVY